MPTLKCNFSCPYCFEESNRINIRKNTNYFEILKLFSNKYFKFYKHIEISLFGGEPLLVNKQIWDYLLYIKKLSKNSNFTYSTSITTNGSLVTEYILKKLIEHNCKSL